MIRTVLITNIPAPYREKIHKLVSNQLNNLYTVIYLKSIEPNRKWKFQLENYNKIFLKSRSFEYSKYQYIHFTFRIWKELNKINPQVVITTGFSPTMLLAFIWCKIKKRKHICFTDGTIQSEKNLSRILILLRKIVFRYTSAFIGASENSLDLYRNYKIPNKNLFISYLCANNDYFIQFKNSKKKYDIMFSGQLIDRKMPLFFINVAKKIKKKLGKCSVLIIGSGDLKDTVINMLKINNIDYSYPGFIQQEDLPKHYASAKVLLFPTLNDPWGLVANEACAVGVPVITCNNAGAANELIIHNYNGFVLPIQSDDNWAEHTIKLINDSFLYQTLSKNAIESIQKYNYENAAKGIVNAIKHTSTIE